MHSVIILYSNNAIFAAKGKPSAIFTGRPTCISFANFLNQLKLILPLYHSHDKKFSFF